MSPGARTTGIVWLVVGVIIGVLLSVMTDIRFSPPPVPVSTIIARAAAELRCECPPPPACPVARPVSRVAWTDPWWKDTAGKYGIVVVEPRLHPALIFIITDTLTKIPPTWNAIVFFSNKNDKFLHLALEPWIKTGRVTLKPFPDGDPG